MIFLIILTVIMILAGVTGYYMTIISLTPKKWDYKESYEHEIENENFDDQWFSSLVSEDVYTESRDGLKLHGIWFPLKDSLKTIIISHGYSYTLYGSVKYMKMFMDRGYNILLIDHRYHGLSEGKICTMGHKEKMDQLKWVNWIENRVGKDTIVGLHGESMGASTSLLHGAIDDRIKFIIADCPYQSVAGEFKYRLKMDKKLPAFPFIQLANLFTKIRTGAFYGEISPLKAVKKIKVPVLFIHGDADDFTPPSNTINLHNAKEGTGGFIYIVPGAEHAGSYMINPEQYKKIVYRFMDNLGE